MSSAHHTLKNVKFAERASGNNSLEVHINHTACILLIYILCTYVSPYCNSMPITRSCILDIAPSRPRAVPDSPNISPGPRGMTSISLSTYSVRHKQEALPSLLEDTVWWMLRNNPIHFSLYIPPLYILPFC